MPGELLLEGRLRVAPGEQKVYRGDGAFCNKGDGAFVLDGNTVFLAEGPFCNKTDAIFQVQGDIPMIALLAVLAGY